MRKLLVPIVLCFAVTISGCPKDNPSDVLSPQPMYKFYVAHHWVPLPEPDSKFGPGAVFTLVPGDDPRWQGTLGDCGVPSSLLQVSLSDSGQLTFDVSSDYGASAVLKIGGVTAGPQFSKVKTSSLQLDKHGTASLDMINIRLWWNDPANKDKIPQACKTILDTPNTYIVQEAYCVSKGKYTLKDSTNAKISLQGLQAGPLNIGADAHASPSADGSLVFDETLYTAVRRLVYAAGGWQSLGQQSDQPNADEKVLGQLKYVSK